MLVQGYRSFTENTIGKDELIIDNLIQIHYGLKMGSKVY